MVFQRPGAGLGAADSNEILKPQDTNRLPTQLAEGFQPAISQLKLPRSLVGACTWSSVPLMPASCHSLQMKEVAILAPANLLYALHCIISSSMLNMVPKISGPSVARSWRNHASHEGDDYDMDVVAIRQSCKTSCIVPMLHLECDLSGLYQPQVTYSIIQSIP